MPENLQLQQLALTSSDYDLRITNLARFIHKKLPIHSGSLIDIGAGNGLFLKFFKHKGFSIEGVELEKDQVHQMRQDFKLKGVTIRQGDITKLKGGENYDVVIASDVIEHIKDDRQALSNLYSFVKKGGYLVITVPAYQHLYGKRDKNWGHFRRYNKKDLVRKLLELPNSQITTISYWNFIAYFPYFFFEKIMHRPIAEKFRYDTSFLSRLVRRVLDTELRFEEMVGITPLGLTLVSIIKKV